MLTIKLDKEPYDAGVMFLHTERTFNEGLTILTGCNGSGKTTIINYVEHKYRSREYLDKYKVFKWYGLTDKGDTKYRALYGDIGVLADLAMSSEGEEINTNLALLAADIGKGVRKDNKNIILLIDGADSGLSIDNIIDLKDFFKDLLIPDVQKSGREIYIIISANSYEMANGEECTDARTGDTVKFEDYEDYRRYIIKSKEYKDERCKDAE